MKKLLCLALLTSSLLMAMNNHESADERERTYLGLLCCACITGCIGVSTFCNGTAPGAPQDEPYSVAPMAYGTIMVGGSLLCFGKAYYDLCWKRPKIFNTPALREIIIEEKNREENIIS